MKKILLIVLILILVSAIGSSFLLNGKRSANQVINLPVEENKDFFYKTNKEKFEISDSKNILENKELIQNADEFFKKHNNHNDLKNVKVIKQEKILKSELKKKFPNIETPSLHVEEGRVLYVTQYTVENYADSNLEAEEVMITSVWDAETEERISSAFKILKNGKIYGMPSQNP